MPPSMVFAFGPDSSFFFYCDGQIVHDNCSWAFKKTVLPRISRPYHISLGPGEDEYCAFYETKDDSRWLSANYPATPGLVPLQDFFKDTMTASPNHIHTTAAVATVDGKYFGCTLTHATDFRYAPVGIKEALLERTGVIEGPKSENELFNCSPSPKPMQISVGIQGAWFIRWQDGLSAWDLGQENTTISGEKTGQSSYHKLRSLLGHDTSKTAPLALRQSINYLVLDAWNRSHWFCVMDCGTKVHYSLSDKTARKISPILIKHLQDKQTTSTFGGPFEDSGLCGVHQGEAEESLPEYHEAIVGRSKPSMKKPGFWKRLT